MDVSLINIGDELLIGQVVNTNAATMGRLLCEAGFVVKSTLVVGDTYESINRALRHEVAHAPIVLLTGGLGPTKDDITKQVLCDFFSTTLEESPEALANVERLFRIRGFEMTAINRAQALVPKGCTVLNNDVGTAPCMWFDGKTVVVALPGVPFEMEWLMRHRVIPKLREAFSTQVIAHKNILVEGIGESFLSDLIEPWELSLPSCLRLAYLPSAGLTKLRITFRGTQDEPNPTSDYLPSLYALAGKYIVGEDCEDLPELAHRLLTSAHATLATAESCTGGNVARLLTAQAGASHYFKGGVVAYSNEVKEAALGVKAKTLATYGAVSEETAREMAEGVRTRLGADYAIATTGIAGPDGGTPDKPVGTVWIAIASASQQTIAQRMQHPTTRRQQNIDRTTNQALAMLIRMLCPKE